MLKPMSYKKKTVSVRLTVCTHLSSI